MIFVDTSAFFALVDEHDPRHLTAKEKLEGMLEQNEALITHNYVLVETYALLPRRVGFEAARKFYRDVYQLSQILWVSQTQHERASKIFVTQKVPRYSFVDCVSFELMRTHGIKQYFAFDEDFKHAGFEPA